MGQIKLKDIADQLGLHVSVISKALNPNSARYSTIAQDTKEKIVKVAAEMGYRRNRIAEFLQKGKSATLGCFLPQIPDRLVADLMFGMSRQATISGFPLNFFFGDTLKQFSAFLDETASGALSGILTYPITLSLETEIGKKIEKYRKKGGQVVILNPQQEYDNLTSVGMDEEYGGRLAAKHLIERGCKKLFFLQTDDIFKRGQGFCIEASIHGIKPREFLFEETDKILRQIKKCPSGNCGIFCTSDFAALKIMKLINNGSMIIGKDILLMGYDDQLFMDELPTPLSTIHQPFLELGHCAIKTLIAMIDAKEYQTSTLITPYLVPRFSTLGF